MGHNRGRAKNLALGNSSKNHLLRCVVRLVFLAAILRGAVPSHIAWAKSRRHDPEPAYCGFLEHEPDNDAAKKYFALKLFRQGCRDLVDEQMAGAVRLAGTRLNSEGVAHGAAPNWSRMISALQSGEHWPTHLRARKPL
jgi:hypothetical protein